MSYKCWTIDVGATNTIKELPGFRLEIVQSLKDLVPKIRAVQAGTKDRRPFFLDQESIQCVTLSSPPCHQAHQNNSSHSLHFGVCYETSGQLVKPTVSPC